MKANIEKRLEQLEAGTGGGHVVVDVRELTDEQAQAAIAQAERQVGKQGSVIILQYAKTWPPALSLRFCDLLPWPSASRFTTWPSAVGG